MPSILEDNQSLSFGFGMPSPVAEELETS
jgi:hypothetical protein